MYTTYLLPLLLSTSVPFTIAGAIPAPAVAPTSYLILSADLQSQFAQDPSPGTLETDTVTVKTNRAQANPTTCTATWDAMTANTYAGVGVLINFKCDVAGMAVSMQRRSVVDYSGWDLNVQEQ